MLEIGLLSEITALWDLFYKSYPTYECPPSSESLTTGVWQSIGFKEFIPYLAYIYNKKEVSDKEVRITCHLSLSLPLSLSSHTTI